MAKKEEKIEELESDFADEIVEKTPENPEEKTTKVEPTLYKEIEADSTTVPLTDELLIAVEESRSNFYKTYQKSSSKKTFISIGFLTLILFGWILPNAFLGTSNSTLSFIISLVVSAGGIVGISLFSKKFRKETDAKLKDYFALFYKNTYEFAFKDTNVEHFEGNLDSKVDEEVFKSSNLFRDIYKVGSRYFSTFSFDKLECSICDAAAQSQEARGLRTQFVGKYLTTTNSYTGDGIYVYFKGKESRALPPNNLSSFEVVQDTLNYVIYGDTKDVEKVVTDAFKKHLELIKTDNTLIEVAIAIKAGRTHVLLGYEDDLMVIPLQNSVNQKPYEKFKNDINVCLNIMKYIESIK